MNNIIIKVRKELKANIELKYKKGAKNFFNEPIKLYGVRAPIVRKISAENFAELKNLPKEKIFALCEKMLQTNYNEEATIAFDWAKRIQKNYTKNDFQIFSKWINRYVTNWAMCDDFCTHAFGYLVLQYPQYVKKLKSWTKSSNRWEKRAAAVTIIPLIKKNEKYLTDVFEIADKLLLDEDDLVQKGYGWMLKEAANHYQKDIFNFVMKRKQKMPRTALRYAIEKMPVSLKKKAME